MRLIDADELKKELANLVLGGEEKLKDYYINGSKLDENAWIGGIYDAWELIEDAPTVEPTFGMFREMLCAECGKRPQVKVLIAGEQIYPQIEKGREKNETN